MKAVFFDLYETLVTHFDPDWVPPPRSVAQRLGLDEHAFAELWQHFDRAWARGEIGHYEDALAQLCIALGKEPDAHLCAELASEYRARTSRVFETVEGDVVEMVVALKRSGLMLGIITNAGDLDTAPWQNCSLAPLFDDFVASHRVGLLKPDRAIYELACRRLDVLPSEAIFVGDGGANELRGAAEAGLTAFWCTWFLDRWPEGIRPNGFTGDEWRQRPAISKPPYDRYVRPCDLLTTLLK